jgi:rhomboid protease GluP
METVTHGSVANQIVAHCIAREGFTPGVPPEAQELEAACDIILSRVHWSQLHILCLVDGETHPGKQFGLMPGRVEAIAKDCLRYSGSINFNKMPVLVEIVEIAPGPPTDEDRARLRHFRRASIFSKGVLFAERVDATARTVWRNRWQLTRTTPERALRAAPVAQGEVETALEEQQVFLHSQRPLVTWILPALLAVVFVLELAASGGSTPTVITLISLGGINQKLVLAGEWWRMASGTVLHADLNHLLANGISLLIACSTLEALVGRAWAAAIYVVAALAGATASVFSDSTALVSVGASGAVMGVVAAATLCGLVRRRREFGMEAFRLLISVLIPTLGLAVWGGSGAAQIDHHAHFGGAVGGALTAAVLVVGWKKSEPLPPARSLAWTIVAIGCAALAVAAVEVARHHADQDVRLVPESTLPSDLAQRSARFAQLVADYPGDPRTHFALGAQHWRGGRLEEAEGSFRKGLGLERTLMLYFEPQFALQIRSVLVGVLHLQHKDAEAREIARPICDLPPDSPLIDERMRTARQTVCR